MELYFSRKHQSLIYINTYDNMEKIKSIFLKYWQINLQNVSIN